MTAIVCYRDHKQIVIACDRRVMHWTNSYADTLSKYRSLSKWGITLAFAGGFSAIPRLDEAIAWLDVAWGGDETNNPLPALFGKLRALITDNKTQLHLLVVYGGRVYIARLCDGFGMVEITAPACMLGSGGATAEGYVLGAMRGAAELGADAEQVCREAIHAASQVNAGVSPLCDVITIPLEQ